MKKLCTLLLAAGLILSASAPVQAVETRISGKMEFLWTASQSIPVGAANTFMNSKDFAAAGKTHHWKHFAAQQRLLVGAQFIASENLSAYADIIAGYMTWGGPAAGMGENAPQLQGGALGTRSANIILRQAFMDWTIPNTAARLRMGLMFQWMPGFAAGNPALASETGTGIQFNMPINDNVSLSANWVRLVSDPRRGSLATPALATVHDTADQFAVLTRLRFDAGEFIPWAGMVVAGKGALTGATRWATERGGAAFADTWDASNLLPESAAITAAGKKPGEVKSATAWWLGFDGELRMFDPFLVGVDFAYGDNSLSGAYARRGWYVSAKASYKTQYGVPALIGWYTPGDDSNPKNGSERMPVVNGGFNPGADIFFANSRGHIENMYENGKSNGTWGLSLQWNNLSFMEGLRHSVKVTYIKGNNSAAMARYHAYNIVASYLTNRDSVVEVDFNNYYDIYKNLQASLELSYLFQDIDEKLRTNAARDAGQIAADKHVRYSNAWRIGLGLRYTF